MRENPLINTGHTVHEGKEKTKGSLLKNLPVVNETSEKKGELIIHELW